LARLSDGLDEAAFVIISVGWMMVILGFAFAVVGWVGAGFSHKKRQKLEGFFNRRLSWANCLVLTGPRGIFGVLIMSCPRRAAYVPGIFR
jgi:uncharacterized membrane protein